jgi:MFS family permease
MPGNPGRMVVLLPCIAQFVIVLDATIVAIALPAMATDLRLSPAGLGWVITAYTLVFGGCLLTAGQLSDRMGRRCTFVVGLLTFAAASVVGGIAPNGAVLLAARAAQGVGAALVSPAALALVTAARPNGWGRARALGWWTAAAAGGGASGWMLGGLLSGLLHWRWVFLVNVPVCLAAAAAAPRVLREWRHPSPGRPDVGGAVLATGALAVFLLTLTSIGTRGPLAPATLVGAVVTTLLVVVLAMVEVRAPNPLLDRTILGRPGVFGPNAVAAVLTATTTPPMLLCILHAQQVANLGPTAAGLLFPPFNLAVVAGSLGGPRVVAAVGEGRAMAAGLVTIAVGALSLYAIAPGAPPLATMVGGFLLLGGGLGVASVASTARGTAAVVAAHQGLASGLLATSAQLGTAISLAIVVPIAAAHTRRLGSGPAAQVAGYELGFAVAAALAALTAGVIAVAALRSRQAYDRGCDQSSTRRRRSRDSTG